MTVVGGVCAYEYDSDGGGVGDGEGNMHEPQEDVADFVVFSKEYKRFLLAKSHEVVLLIRGRREGGVERS